MIPLTGSAWAGELLQHLGHSNDGICNLRVMGVKQSMHHIIWECECCEKEKENLRTRHLLNALFCFAHLDQVCHCSCDGG